MEHQEAKELLEKYRNNSCTEEELAMLESWYNKHELEGITKLSAADWDSINETTAPAVKRENRLWPRIAVGAAAAVALLIVGAGLWFYAGNNTVTIGFGPDKVIGTDIAPGKNTATLTSNGKTINLSEAKTGVAIDATALTYNDGTKIDPSALGMENGASRSLEVTTPRGGIYSVILQDGTKVWLNADSKLEFLSNYRNELQRIVKLTGEAYFEVAKNKRQPFIVQTSRQVVEVLGTHFNISAYAGEGIKTTLIEGSVAVTSTTARPKRPDERAIVYPGVVLKPNQQAVLTNNTIKCIEVDASEAVAWKEGKFSFNREEMGTIMKNIERWYNIEAVYQNGADKVKFTGTISRYENISGVIKMLESTGELKFKLEGRKLYVSK